MSKARIKIASVEISSLNDICSAIKEIASKSGVVVCGPIPLPTKKLKVTTMKTPCGDGTGHGNTTFDNWEMRIHKRLIDIQADERALRQILRVHVPQGVHISIKLQN